MQWTNEYTFTYRYGGQLKVIKCVLIIRFNLTDAFKNYRVRKATSFTIH